MADEPLDPAPEGEREVELDISAFLPEGTELDGDWGDDAPEPEVPAWARGDVDAPKAIAPEVQDGEPATDPDPEPEAGLDPGPVVERVRAPASGGGAEEGADEEIDLGVLEGVEADLREVDDAIAALDAGDPDRSALLRRLVGS